MHISTGWRGSITLGTMPARRSRPTDLREACIDEALAVIEAFGVERLSLREVARRLGVSHQAPYKHFPSRDHILAEIVARAFDAFAAHLDARPRSSDPYEDLGEMGRAYIGYARAHPLQYRLMFGTPLPDPAEHPDMMHRARHAFSLLSDAIGRLDPRPDIGSKAPATTLDALYVWSTVHGLASLLQTDAARKLDLSEDVVRDLVPHVLGRIGTGLRPLAPPVG